MSSSATTDYRLAPVFAARLVGLGLMLLAVVVFGYSVAALSFGWPADVIVVLVVLGVAGILGTATWLRSRAFVVRFTETGYQVRFVRGVGVAEGRWDEVGEAATAYPREVPCLVLQRQDGSTTSIPVEMLAVDRDQFVDDVRRHLDRAAGRPG